jgi:reductive dehalogenase
MKLFSYRNRPVHMGPYPLERLRPGVGTDISASAFSRKIVPNFDVSSFARVLDQYSEIYDGLAEGPIATQTAPLPDDTQKLANVVKAACYFLDAAMVGIAGGATKTIVIMCRPPKTIEPSNPAAGWTENSAIQMADFRAQEIATAIAGYIRILGYSAAARSARTRDLNIAQLIYDAGLGTVQDGRITNPYLGTRFGIAVVTTGMNISADAPVAARSGLSKMIRETLPFYLGVGGTAPELSNWLQRNRPAHMGTVPMEVIKKIEQPTTRIDRDKIVPMPKRASFFERARKGDLGEKTRIERERFAMKEPLGATMLPILGALGPYRDGPVAATPAGGAADNEANAQALKALCYFAGADLVGISEAHDHVWYSHDADGTRLKREHKFGIIILIDQGHETMDGASGDDWISGVQSMRAYMRAGGITGLIAAHIRRLGYKARSHTSAHGDVLQLPMILDAGLGELSRIGELVLNPFMGPRFKSGAITTDMPLSLDRPIDFGLQQTCASCKKCARECPCAAISFGKKIMFNGYEMWKPDVERCARYRMTNTRGAGCSRCMKMCPYNNEGLISHRAFLWLAIKFPSLGRPLAKLDDMIGNGKINAAKNWWLDLEIIGSFARQPAGVNRRGLHADKDESGKGQKIAYYTPDLVPDGAEQNPAPVDRKAALAKASILEKPRRKT